MAFMEQVINQNNRHIKGFNGLYLIIYGRIIVGLGNQEAFDGTVEIFINVQGFCNRVYHRDITQGFAKGHTHIRTLLAVNRIIGIRHINTSHFPNNLVVDGTGIKAQN